MIQNYFLDTKSSKSHTALNLPLVQNGQKKFAKKGPFIRKKLPQERSAQKKLPLNSEREHRQERLIKKPSFQTEKPETLQKCSSGQIKYLSPHFNRKPAYISPPPKQTVEPKQRFLRPSQLFSDDLINQCSLNIKSKKINWNNQSILGNEGSLQSKMTNHTQQQSMSNDWIGLESQNNYLKSQKLILQKRVSQLQELLKKTSIKRLVTKQSEIQLCCDDCLLKKKKPVKVESKQIKNNDKQLSKKIEELRVKFKQDENKMRDLELEVFKWKQLYEIENRSRAQLQEMVQVFKTKCEQSQKTLQSLSIKQNILLRQKAQFQNVKLIAHKLDKQREALRKTLGQYKQKINLLTSFIAKSRKMPLSQEQIDFSLDLSTSIDFY